MGLGRKDAARLCLALCFVLSMALLTVEGWATDWLDPSAWLLVASLCTALIGGWLTRPPLH